MKESYNSNQILYELRDTTSSFGTLRTESYRGTKGRNGYLPVSRIAILNFRYKIVCIMYTIEVNI